MQHNQNMAKRYHVGFREEVYGRWKQLLASGEATSPVHSRPSDLTGSKICTVPASTHPQRVQTDRDDRDTLISSPPWLRLQVGVSRGRRGEVSHFCLVLMEHKSWCRGIVIWMERRSERCVYAHSCRSYKISLHFPLVWSVSVWWYCSRN